MSQPASWTTHLTLREIAPPLPASIEFGVHEKVWILTLDQIEAHTGVIRQKIRALARRAGSSTFPFDTGNVLYSKLRPYLNKVVCPDEPGLATTELVPLRPDPRLLDPRFLAHYLRSAAFVRFAERRVAGVKMPRIIMDKLWDHVLPIPPLSEQRRIVEILDQADALRRKRADADRKAERILSTLFHAMFRDSARDRTPLKQLLRDSKGALQSGPFGSRLHNADFVDKGTVLAVGIDNVHDTGFQLGRNRRIALNKYEELKKFTLEPGDVLISIMGTVGRTCVFPEWAGTAICTKHVYRIQADLSRLEPEYLCAALRFAPEIRAQLGSSITGQIVEAITSRDLEQLLVAVPSLPVQRRFATLKQALDREAQRRRESGLQLAALVESVSHRAFSGHLTARWREEHREEPVAEGALESSAGSGTPGP